MRNGCRLSLRIALAISIIFLGRNVVDAEVTRDVVPASHENVTLKFEDVAVAAKPAPALISSTHAVAITPETAVPQSPPLPKPTARLFFLLALCAVLGGRHLVVRRR